MNDDEILYRNAMVAIGEGKRAFRVSAEHYVWLSRGAALVNAIIQEAGGTVDGGPTSRVNILQRIRQLVEIERRSLSILHEDGR